MYDPEFSFAATHLLEKMNHALEVLETRHGSNDPHIQAMQVMVAACEVLVEMVDDQDAFNDEAKNEIQSQISDIQSNLDRLLEQCEN